MNGKLVFAAVSSLLLCVWVYHPALGGWFTFDDQSNIQNNELLQIEDLSFSSLWQASLSGRSGLLKRPVSMLSFAINHVFTGMNTWWMKITNLVIHLFNGFLVFVVVRKIVQRVYCRIDPSAAAPSPTLLAYVIASIWLLHPVNVSAVSYIVQRMTSLSAIFVLLGLYCYFIIREQKSPSWKVYVSGILLLVCWLLGLLSKETAILLSVYIFVIEYSLFHFSFSSTGEKTYLTIIWALLAAPWVAAFFYVIYDPGFILNHYSEREFSLMERLYTEGRIVIDYLRLVIFPDITQMGLYHDNILISKSLITPPTTLLSILLIAGLLISAIYTRKKLPLYCLGILWFFGGQILESSVFPLELMFLHRNYLPSIGILLSITAIGVAFYQDHQKLLTVGVIVVFFALCIATRFINYQWSDDLRMQLLHAMNAPDSARSLFRAGQVVKLYAVLSSTEEKKEEYQSLAIEYFAKIRALDENDLSGTLSILGTYLHMDKEPPQALIDDIVMNLHSAKMDLGMIHIFESYGRCLTRKGKECPLRPVDFMRIEHAFLTNPKVTGSYKSSILITHAKYLAEREENIDAAIAKVVESLSVYAGLEHLMLLVRYYEQGGYFKEMESILNIMEASDRLGVSRKFVLETRVRMKEKYSY